MPARWMVYGAYGYTGRLIVEQAHRLGMSPIVAGRSLPDAEAVGRAFGLEAAAFSLSDTDRLRSALSQVDVVLNAAGPYSRTCTPMIDACLERGIDYIDLCGEFDVLERVQRRDPEARRRGSMILMGAGFDVVPSDCLVAHLRQRLPDGIGVRLYIGGMQQFSRGSLRTAMESIAAGTRIRRDGGVVEQSQPGRAFCDFGDGSKPALGVTLGDVSTAWWSGRTPNIEVFFESMPALEGLASAPAWLRTLLGSRTGQWCVNRLIDFAPVGPSAESRRTLRTTLVGEAYDTQGRVARSVLRTPEGYQLSAFTAVEIARRALAKDRSVGVQTASMAYGADFILDFPDVIREDEPIRSPGDPA